MKFKKIKNTLTNRDVITKILHKALIDKQSPPFGPELQIQDAIHCNKSTSAQYVTKILRPSITWETDSFLPKESST